MESIRAIVLAAGKGSRMHTEKPKVLVELLDRPMLDYVLSAIDQAGIEDVLLVVGHQAERVKQAFADRRHALQQPLLGTGHAVMQAREFEDQDGYTLVINGDAPLLTEDTLKSLIEKSRGYAMSILSAHHPEPAGYGRIVRNEDGDFEAIVEARDCTPEQLAITEINSGIYCFDNRLLFQALKELRTDNAQNEYYLTDVAKILKAQGHPIQALALADVDELLGINNARDLEKALKALQRRINAAWMDKGVFLEDSEQIVIGKNVSIEPGVIIQAPARIEGESRIEKGCVIGFGSCLRDARLMPGVHTINATIISAEVPADSTVLGIWEDLHD